MFEWVKNKTNTVGNNLSDAGGWVAGVFVDTPAETAAKNELKNTVFSGRLGFSPVEDFSEDFAKAEIKKQLEELFSRADPKEIPRDFSDELKKGLVEELLKERNAGAISDSAKAYYAELVSDTLSENFEDRWYQSAGKWAKDTALPTAVSGVQWASALFPPTALLSEAAGQGSAGILKIAPGLKDTFIGSGLQSAIDNNNDYRAKRADAADYTVGFGKFAINNPGRAGALAAQGVTNAVVSTVGLVTDAVVYAGYDVVVKTVGGNIVVGAHNIFAEKENRLDALTPGKFFAVSEWANEKTQFTDRIKPNGEKYGTLNENAKYERVLLYGPQAATELFIVVGASAVTAGAAGAAYASLRTGGAWTARTLGTAEQIKKVEAVSDAAKLLRKLEKAENKVADAKQTLEKAGTELAQTDKIIYKVETVVVDGNKLTPASASTAGQSTAQETMTYLKPISMGKKTEDVIKMDQANVAKAQEQLLKAQEKLAAAQEKAFSPKLGIRMKHVETTGATTQDFVQGSARALAKETDKLEALKASGASAEKIAKSEQNIANLTQEVALKAAQAERVGAQVSSSNGVMKLGTEEMTRLENMRATYSLWAHKGARFTDPGVRIRYIFDEKLMGPTHIGHIERSINLGLAGGVMGLGVYVDTKQGEAELQRSAASEAKRAAETNTDEAGFKRAKEEMAKNLATSLDEGVDLSKYMAPITPKSAQQPIQSDFNNSSTQLGADKTSPEPIDQFNSKAQEVPRLKVDLKLLQEMQNAGDHPPSGFSALPNIPMATQKQ